MRTLAFLILASLAGCSAAPDPRPVADDPVCLYEGDLGCVRVRVDEKTPRAQYAGKTYYFCAEDCRREFEKNPEKYLSAPKK